MTPDSKKPPSRTSARKKSARRKTPAQRGTKSEPATAPAGAATATIDPQELRERWARARRIVGEVVGQEAEHDPRIWERGVYQLWLWLVIELLVVRRDDINVGDLSAISKMLHDQRKLSLDEAKRQGAEHEPSNGQLPERFGELVRQIYGANFQDDARPVSEGGAE